VSDKTKLANWRRRPSPTEESRWAYPARDFEDGDDSSPIDLRNLSRTLLRRWWILLLCTSGAGALAWFWTQSRPLLYSATATVRLIDSRNSLASGLVESRGSSQAVTSPLRSEVQILKSRGVAAKVIDQDPLSLRVTTRGIAASRLTQVLITDSSAAGFFPLASTASGMIIKNDTNNIVPFGTLYDGGGIKFAIAAGAQVSKDAGITLVSREQAVDRVLSGLRADERTGTDLIDIRFTSADHDVARRVVNALALVYQAEDALASQQQSRRRRTFIEEQLFRNDAQLLEAERALGDFRARQQAYSAEQKFDAEQRNLASLRVQLREAESDHRYAMSLVNGLVDPTTSVRRHTERMLSSSPDIISSPTIGRLVSQLDSLFQRRTELTSGRSGKLPAHPYVEQQDSLIADTEDALITAVRAHVAVLGARVQSLTDLVSGSEGALRGLPSAEAQQARLTQNAEVLREQSALLRTEYQRARIAEAAAVGRVEIVDLATRAHTLPAPVMRVVVFALFLGLLSGAAIAIAIESTDRSVKRREDVEEKLRMPVIVTIPLIPRATVGRKLRLVPPALRSKGAAAAQSLQTSGAAQAFRQLVASLFLGRNGHTPRRLLVTSAVAGEGKTTVAVNVAITLAQQGQRVLLIDCDFYHPRVHGIFSIPLSPGVTETVLERSSEGAVLHETGVGGLFVMTAGDASGATGQIATNPRFEALIEDMLHDFTTVILDAPPVLAVADPTVLTFAADSVVVVVRAGQVEPHMVGEALRILSSVEAPLAGAILNDPEGKVRLYGGYSYGYQYR
jgi:capsular exopolysaccharide synthesis family protein